MNTTANLRRIQNEIKQIREQSNEYSKMFQLTIVNDNVYHWRATIYGPEESFYEGYKFELDISLPNNYPFSPPNVKFITPIKHVNVNSKGDICLDILKNNWAPSQNIHSVLMSLILLLKYPNIDDPFNPELAELYHNDIKEYERVIKFACEKYATKI